MLGGEKEYNMAVALLNFKAAYQRLVKASKALPDLDVTEGYPFFLLDFEQIEPAVLSWCTVHAGKLLDQCPEIVENPACLKCEYFGQTMADGQCKGQEVKNCGIYPKIMFSREQCIPALQRAGVYSPKLTDNEVYLLYQQEVLKAKS